MVLEEDNLPFPFQRGFLGPKLAEHFGTFAVVKNPLVAFLFDHFSSDAFA